MSSPVRKPILRAEQTFFRPRMESLENRLAPAIDLLLVAQEINSVLGSVETALITIDSAANKIPILDKALSDIPEVIDTIADVRAKLKNAVENSTLADLGPTIKQGIFNLIGPNSSIKILADSNGDNVVTVADVQFVASTTGPAGFEVKLNLFKSITVATTDLKFGFGIDGLPFEVSVGGDPAITLSIDFAYQDLTFGWANDLPYFKADAYRELEIGLSADVTGEFDAILGFLKISATPEAPAAGEHHLDLNFTMDIGANGSISDPVINGTAEVTLKLKAEVGDNFPTVSADLEFYWEFINTDPGADTNSDFGNEPELALNNVEVGLGGILSSVLGPIVDVLQPILEPFQPIIDFLEAPIPVLSPVYESLNPGVPLTLLKLVDIAAGLGGIPDDYEALVTLTTDVLIPLADLIDTIGSLQGEVMIPLGNFNLKTLANKDLRLLSPLSGTGTLKQRIAALANGASLQADFDFMGAIANTFSYTNIETGVDNLGITPDEKVSLKDQLSKIKNQDFFDFPILDDPIQGIISVLMGKDVDLFTFTAVAEIDLLTIPLVDLTFPLGPVALIAGLGLEGNVNAVFKAGYDTSGLRQYIDSSDGLHLLNGFWIGEDSELSLSLTLNAYVGVSAYVFAAGITGGLTASLFVGMDDSDVDGKVHLDELDSCLFEAGGALDLALSAFVKVGVDVPVIGFVGYQQDFPLANIELISFDIGGCVDNPFKNDSPVHLAGKSAVETELVYPSDPEKTKDFFLKPGMNGILNLNTGARAINRHLDNSANNVDVAEAYVITHYEPAAGELLPPGAPAGEIILVSAFGITEKYYGVQEIRGNFGAGNDSIKVKSGVQAILVFNGEDGDDNLVSDGSGKSTFKGGNNNDTLSGGTGINTLYGDAGNDNLKGNGLLVNNLFGGQGDDVLEGGDGLNKLYGDMLGSDRPDDQVGGNDTLNSAGPLPNLLQGNAGNDNINTGLGNDIVLGGDGDDQINWQFGNGKPTIDGGAGLDSVALLGGDAKENFTVINTAGVIGFESRIDYSVTGGINITPVVFKLVENLSISGNGGKDTILIKPLETTSLVKIGINLGDIIQLDHLKDQITVEGTQVDDNFAISLVDKVKLYARKDSALGGVTLITKGNLKIYAANVLDQLDVPCYSGNDLITVSGISGPTKIDTAAGDDRIFLSASTAEQFLAHLVIDAGGGKNYFEFSDTVPGGTTVIAKTSEFKSTNVPLGASLSWAAPGPHNTVIKTGEANDTVHVKATNLLSTLKVFTFGGADSVTVGDIVYGQLINGSALALIQGSLFLDTGSGANGITIDDNTAKVGHGNVIVNATQVLNYAPKPINYVSTGGTLGLTLQGSNHGPLAETFIIQSPNALLSLHANAGNDTIRIESVTIKAAITGGKGNDIIQFSNPVLSLSPVGAMVTISGDDGTDQLLVNDQGAPASQVYDLTQSSLTRSGAGRINFGTIEKMEVTAGNFNDTVTVLAPAAMGAPYPEVIFNGGGGTTDSLIGPNTINTWLLTGPNTGSLNTTFSFKNFERLTGGTGNDLFKPSSSTVFLGNLSGGSGVDTLNYGTFISAVTVNLTTSIVSQISGTAVLFENAIGGSGNDFLNGNTLANRLEGGNGNDTILGLAGNDALFGGNGRDFIIGGIGADTMDGGADEDLLIGGGTIHDGNQTALGLIFNEWNRTNLGYTGRITNLRNGGGLNGTTKINAASIINDNTIDTMVGGIGSDWFWAQTGGVLPDILFDRVLSELVN